MINRVVPCIVAGMATAVALVACDQNHGNRRNIDRPSVGNQTGARGHRLYNARSSFLRIQRVVPGFGGLSECVRRSARLLTGLTQAAAAGPIIASQLSGILDRNASEHLRYQPARYTWRELEYGTMRWAHCSPTPVSPLPPPMRATIAYTSVSSIRGLAHALSSN